MALPRSPSASLDRQLPCSICPSSSFPLTPTKNCNDTTIMEVVSDPIPETPTSSLRERRGRLNTTANTFRPLSIFTQSFHLPFDLDIEKGFEVLKGDSPDRLKEAELAVSSTHKRLKMTKNKPDTSPSLASSRDASLSSSLESVEDPFECRRNADMDLMTALKVTSPEKDKGHDVCADFVMLCELPAPQYSQHPAFSVDPFKAISEAPLLSTLTSIDEIKRHNPRMRKSNEDSIGSGKDSLERKRSFFGLDFKTPASARSRNAFSTPGTQPPSSSSTSGTTSPPSKNIFSRSAPETSVPQRESGPNTSLRSRKFSDKFKSKKSSEEEPWSLRSPSSPSDSPNLNREDLERYVRRTTNTPTYDYDPTSAYPRHPNTGRGWKSRNLKCTNCIEGSCVCCGRCCCAFRAAVLALDHHREGTPGRTTALHRIQEITKLYPYGKEVPTFLCCTQGTGGDGVGCGKLVCPDCCSICPDQACGDTQCRKCKPAMWEECTWHRGVSFI